VSSVEYNPYFETNFISIIACETETDLYSLLEQALSEGSTALGKSGINL
jgi:hypothetical protein